MSSPFSGPDRPPQGLPPHTPSPQQPFPGYFTPGQYPMGNSYRVPSDIPRPPTPAPLVLVVVCHVVLGLLTLISGILASGSDFNGLPATGGTVSVIAGLIALGVGAALIACPGNTARIIATVWSGLWCLSIVGLVFSVPIILVLWRSPSVVHFFAVCDQRRTSTTR